MPENEIPVRQLISFSERHKGPVTITGDMTPLQASVQVVLVKQLVRKIGSPRRPLSTDIVDATTRCVGPCIALQLNSGRETGPGSVVPAWIARWLHRQSRYLGDQAERRKDRIKSSRQRGRQYGGRSSQRSDSKVHSDDGEAEIQLWCVPDMQVVQSDQERLVRGWGERETHCYYQLIGTVASRGVVARSGG